MYRLILLYVVILMGLVFMALPDNTVAKDFFPLYDIKLTFQTYVYFLFEHFGMIILSYILAVEVRKYRREVYFFFWLQVVDMIDYVMTYNTTWFEVGDIQVSMNLISVLVFGIVILTRDESLP